MMTVTTSIGRNIGRDGAPMPADDWDRFAADVLRVARSRGPVYFAGFGDGVYLETSEDAFTVVSAAALPDLAGMRADLALLAAAYGQEAIAMTAGGTRFVYASH